MKTVLSGILMLMIPFFLFAQNAKEAQDINLVQKKINKLESENARLKNQVNGIQKSLVRISEAEISEHLDLAKHDSMTKAGQDTVKSYSGRILKLQQDNEEIENALMLRTISFFVILILLIILVGLRWYTHHGKHRKELEQVFEKMNAQREEREKRIAGLRETIELSEKEFAAMKKETGERLAELSENIAHIDRNLQTLLTGKLNELDRQIREGLGGMRKDHDEGRKEFTKKLEEMQSLMASKVNEMGQKIVDSGKKLDEQISAAHKKADEMKTVLAKEIEAIRSKFE